MQSLRILSASFNEGKPVRENTFHTLDIITNVDVIPFKDVVTVFAIPTNRLPNTCYVFLTLKKLKIHASQTYTFRDDVLRTNGAIRLFLKFLLRPRAFLTSFKKNESIEFEVHLLYGALLMSCDPVRFQFINNNHPCGIPIFKAISPDKSINCDVDTAFVIGLHFRPNIRIYFDNVQANICNEEEALAKEWCKILIPTAEELGVGDKTHHVATVRIGLELGNGKCAFAVSSHTFTYASRDVIPLAVSLDLFPELADMIT